MGLQKKHSAGSTITLEFELNASEVSEFRTLVSSTINGSLPISFFFAKNDVKNKITINKPGRGSVSFNRKADEISRFVADRIDIQYIPAVRTANDSVRTVESLVQRELSKITEDPVYIQAIADIRNLQKPILEALSGKISETLKKFLPNVSKSQISIEQQDLDLALSTAFEILVDDGAETSLRYKGDGVQSLAAIAMMRHVSEKEIIIALEEPESHLHPEAIHALKGIVTELSQQNQVVITTHNPIFANRVVPSQNIIVNKSRAYPARSINDVRKILGVQLNDNLASADVILIVEGEEDRISLSGILSANTKLSECLKSGRLAIDVLGGASNLGHRTRLHTSALCKHVRAFLDHDAAGLQAYERAKDDGLLDTSTVNFALRSGKKESELEDLYKEDVYESIVQSEVGLSMSGYAPDAGKKWTERLRNTLRRAGKPIDSATILAIKIKVARAAGIRGTDAIEPNLLGPIESLTAALAAALSQ